MAIEREKLENTKISRRQLLRGVVEPAQPAGDEQVAVIGPNCLALNGVACRNCDDACDERAIRFHPRVGGHYTPSIHSDTCTACGDCVPVCPVGALSIAGDGQHA